MADKKVNKIAIKPMNNAAAIASTLGLGQSAETANDQPISESVPKTAKREEASPIPELPNAAAEKSDAEVGDQKAAAESRAAVQKKTAAAKQTAEKKEPAIKTESATAAAAPPSAEAAAVTNQPQMPLIIDLKRKLPGKELFVLSLLYLQRNNRGLVQMTVGSIMGLYMTVFQDVIKDDTVRRSLKRLSDAGLTKTTSIPGNNSGYVYEIGELLETESFNDAEKEEFAELIDFVRSKLAAPTTV